MPQDYTILQNLPGFGFGGDPSQAVSPDPQASFEDEFERTVLEQFKANSPDEIFKKKMRQYFEDIGVKPTDKPWKSRMASMGREIRESFNSSKENPYVPPKERMRKDAQKEYESLLTPIKGEASLIYQNKKAEKANAARIEQEKIKAEELKRKTESQERINSRKNEILTLSTMARNGVLGAQQKKLEKETEILEQARNENEKDPHYKNASPEYKRFMDAQWVYQNYGEEIGRALNQSQAFGISTAKPTEETALQGLNEPAWKEYSDRKGQLERVKNLGKSANNPFRIQILQRSTPEGQIEQIPAAIDPRNPMAGYREIPSQGELKPLDKKAYDISQRFDAGKIQARGAFGSMASAISAGREGEFTGPGAGNPISKALRTWGIIGDKEAIESSSDVLLSNALALHTQGMMGGGTRYAYQALEDFKQRVANEHIASPKTLMYGMAALIYSIELGAMQNAKTLKDNDVDNVTMSLIRKEIDSTINKAFGNKTLKTKLPVNLRPISQIIQDAKKIRGGADTPVLSGTAAREALNRITGGGKK